MKLTLIQIKLGVVQASLYSMGIMNLTPWEALEDLKSTTHARFLTNDEINEDKAVSWSLLSKLTQILRHNLDIYWAVDFSIGLQFTLGVNC